LETTIVQKKEGNKPYRFFNLILDDLEWNLSDGKVHECIVKIKVFIEFLFKLQALQHISVHNIILFIDLDSRNHKSNQHK